MPAIIFANNLTDRLIGLESKKLLSIGTSKNKHWFWNTTMVQKNQKLYQTMFCNCNNVTANKNKKRNGKSYNNMTCPSEAVRKHP